MREWCIDSWGVTASLCSSLGLFKWWIEESGEKIPASDLLLEEKPVSWARWHLSLEPKSFPAPSQMHCHIYPHAHKGRKGGGWGYRQGGLPQPGHSGGGSARPFRVPASSWYYTVATFKRGQHGGLAKFSHYSVIKHVSWVTLNVLQHIL